MRKNGFYKDLILKEFYYNSQLSCTDLSKRIDKSLPLTTKILNELIDEGFIRESGYAPSSGGRRPLVYTINADTTYILSVAMDQLVTRISLMNIQNRHVGNIEKIDL